MSEIHPVALIPQIKPYQIEGETIPETAKRMLIEEALYTTRNRQQASLLLGMCRGALNTHICRAGKERIEERQNVVEFKESPESKICEVCGTRNCAAERGNQPKVG